MLGLLYPPPPKEKTRYLLYRRLGGLQNQSGRGRKILPPPGFFFVFSSTLFVLHSLSSLSSILPFRLYLQHTTQTSMPPARFKPAVPASERLQTYALDREFTGIGPNVQRANSTGIRSQDRPARSESLY